MKTCTKCGKEKELNCFYTHKATSDGLLHQCKECVKERVKKHREENIERIREYDRKRGLRQKPEYFKEYRKRYPQKYKAKNMVNNAIRDKKLFKQPCEICGKEKAVAHHDDYSKPLNVRWLCQAHHKQWHVKHGEGKNGNKRDE